MQLGNGVELEIKKTYYNKSVVQEDGITHIIDTKHTYPLYQFGLAKNYFDIEDRQEVVKSIIADLQSTINSLNQMLDKEQGLEK